MFKCRICGGNLTVLLDFGRQPLANHLLSSLDEEEYFYDAKWGWCDACQLLQLTANIPLEEMFTAEYPYLTDSSSVMVQHFRNTAKALSEKYRIGKDDLAVEIGCNSGGLLEHMGCKRFGYEPSEVCSKILASKNIPHTDYYFNDGTYSLAPQKAKLIFSANTLRSVPNLRPVLRGIDELLTGDGVLVVEEPYIPDMILETVFDQFYDENIYCFTVNSMNSIVSPYGLEVFSVVHLSNHGGSLQYHIGKIGKRDIDENVFRIGLRREKYLGDFVPIIQSVATETAKEFRSELERFSSNRIRVVGYGATAKSATMLNFAEIGTSLLSVIYDTTPAKWGKFTPGAHIPIRDAQLFKDDPASISVLFAWNHKDEIMAREKGKTWMVYVPEVKYYD